MQGGFLYGFLFYIPFVQVKILIGPWKEAFEEASKILFWEVVQ